MNDAKIHFEKIDHRSTRSFSKTMIDYLADAEALAPFYQYKMESKSVPEVINDMNTSFKLDRASLVQSISSQYQNYVPHLKVVQNIDALANDKTFTVTTAHQLNLFTGPLYYIFKICNAIRVARDLKQLYPEYNFVPCYWMGSEDHDFEEINHTYLFGKKIEWDNYQNGSIGEYKTDGIEPLIQEVRDIIRTGDQLDKLIAMLQRSYSSSTLADAARKLLDELFGCYGLVVIDGNCAELKGPFGSVISSELQEQTSHNVVNDQIAALKQAGYNAQASPRQINLFYKSDNRRERIVAVDDGFELAESGEKFGTDELISMIESYPERFSPNVILRPLHQQFVLPNIAYIGGGGEIAYWLQLKSLHQHYNIHFPMLLPRTSAQIFNAGQLKRLQKFGISKEAIFEDVESLKKAFIQRTNDIDLSLSKELEDLSALYENIATKATSIDAGLKNWVGAEQKKSVKSLENISKRLIKSEKLRNEQSLLQIEKLISQLLPGGKLQERKESFMPIYAQLGHRLIKGLIDHLDPFEKQFTLISIEN